MNILRLCGEIPSIVWMVCVGIAMNTSNSNWCTTLVFKVIPVCLAMVMFFDVLVGFGILKVA